MTAEFGNDQRGVGNSPKAVMPAKIVPKTVIPADAGIQKDLWNSEALWIPNQVWNDNRLLARAWSIDQWLKLNKRRIQ